MDLDTLELLRSSLRHVLTETSDRALAVRLAELGWDEVVADDEPTALLTLFELTGDTLSSADALGPELAATLARVTGDETLARASVVVPYGRSAVVHPDGSLELHGIVLSSGTGALCVPVPMPGTDTGPSRLLVVPAGSDTATFTLTPTGHGTDPSLGWLDVTGTVAAGDLRVVVSPDGTDAWGAALARGRWLVAAELVGIGRHVIRAAVEYTGARVQYGKAIGTFQALQHRIASAHALVVGAGHLVAEAAVDDDPWTALVAKCLAGRAAETACTQAQQCYGAIGFTWEHEFHRYLRRTLVLDALLGDWRALEFEIGTTLQRTRVVPHIGSL